MKATRVGMRARRSALFPHTSCGDGRARHDSITTTTAAMDSSEESLWPDRSYPLDYDYRSITILVDQPF